MNRKFLAVAIAVVLSGCSSLGSGIDAEPIQSISSQKLATSFKRQGIKIEWGCVWGTGITQFTCIKTDIKSIEVTGYAPSFGNTEVMREQAFKVAHDAALDKLIRFVKQDVTSNRVTETMGRNVEKAIDQRKAKIRSEEEVTASDDEFKDSNLATRSNTNETVRTVVDTVRTNAQGIIRGARAIDERIVDRQTVAVVIRWDTDSDRASKFFQKRFSTN
jgi:uncharacterized protein YceK